MSRPSGRVRDMTETQKRIARYVATGIPAETAAMLVAYEMANQGRTSTIGIDGRRVTA